MTHPVERTHTPVGKRRSRSRAVAAATAAAALAVAIAATPADSRPAVARAARTLSLNDTAHLHLTSHHGFTFNEQGSATGTVAGTIYIHLNVVSTNRVTAELNIYPRGGSLSGHASGSYHPSGAVATFSGTMSIAKGTGSFAHASGSGLSFSGTIQRTNDAVTVHVSGRIST